MRQTNQDIAVSIIAHIHRATLGDPLILFEQIDHEVIIDREFVNQRFADNGGAKRFNIVLSDQLDTVLAELSEAIWSKTG